MGYQESFLYIEPQWKFEKLIHTYEKAEQAGYYRVAGAEPRSVVVLKQPLGSIPAGRRLLWVCGDRGFHSVGGVFGGASGVYQTRRGVDKMLFTITVLLAIAFFGLAIVNVIVSQAPAQ